MNFKEFVKTKQDNILEAEELLNEVKFSEKNLNKVAVLYGKIMGKQMGGVFKPSGVETFKRKTGNGNGIRSMNNSGEQLRFNWDAKKSKKAQYDLTSIDYWDANNIDLRKPTRTVMFSPELNVVQVLGKITNALLTGTIQEAEVFIEEANDFLFEKKQTRQDRVDWMTDKGLSKYEASPEKMRKHVQDKAPHLADELEVFLGQKEENSFADGLDKADKLLDSTVYADPDTIFDELEDLTQMVAGRFTKSLVITGMGGIGKCIQGDTKVNIKGLDRKIIKEIFDYIEEKENHKFEIGRQHVNKTSFQIETANGYEDVISMIIKEDISANLYTDKGVVKVSNQHMINTENGLRYVTDLITGDKLKNTNGAATIEKIEIGDSVLVYDLTVNSDGALYLDAQGFEHHNTYHVTEGNRSLLKTLGSAGEKWELITAPNASITSFYKDVYSMRDKIIVWDKGICPVAA